MTVHELYKAAREMPFFEWAKHLNESPHVCAELKERLEGLRRVHLETLNLIEAQNTPPAKQEPR